MIDGYIAIGEFSSSYEAEMALNLLKDGGVEALIGKDDCGGMMPNLQFVQGVRLYVLPRDAEKSMAILKIMAAESADAENGQPWICSKCGTELEPQFTDCWNCGTAGV